jgi:hypothetical protein
LGAKRHDVTTDQNLIKQYRSDIEHLEEQIRGVRDDLPTRQLAAEQAEADAEKILGEIEEAIGLHIKATDSSVLQGGTATFEAEYTTGLPSNALPTHVELRWDTGGCSIQPPGNRHSKTIVVDTSSVQPGDYGISVSLTFV